jgi:hypothetical protein
MIRSHTIHDEAAESLTVTLRCTPDPTGGTVEFALSARGTNTPGTWHAGQLGTWSSATGGVDALTPTIGGASAVLEMTAGNAYWLWFKLVVDSETFVDVAATVVCPGS